jgi:hypothetical protein
MCVGGCGGGEGGVKRRRDGWEMNKRYSVKVSARRDEGGGGRSCFVAKAKLRKQTLGCG